MEIHRKGMEHLNPILKKQLAGKAEQVAPPDLTTRGKPEQVNISQQAKSLSKGLEFLRNTSDVRAEVVAALKARVDAGEYRVDSRKLAEALLQNTIIDL
jgi:flagellar biosynthesis anti-sigma factor FlgM